MRDHAPHLADQFNSVSYPYISPWSFVYDQRWNAEAEDPNRQISWAKKVQIRECKCLMTDIEQRGIFFDGAIDLHETIDRDIENRRLRAKRFDQPLAKDYKEIPQGYYLIVTKKEADEANEKQILLGRSIIEEVQKVSPIAPEATILDGKINNGGIILSAPLEGSTRTFLSGHAHHVVVTEVYPDHPDMNPEKSVNAQIASIFGLLNHIAKERGFSL